VGERGSGGVSVRTAVAVDKCPECGGATVLSSSGELVCSSCGLVVEGPLIDQGPEWRAFTLEEVERRARAGPPISALGLAPTFIGPPRDRISNGWASKRRARIAKLALSQAKALRPDERSLRKALEVIKRLSAKLGLPERVEEEAVKIFKRAREARMLRGRSCEVLAAASVYAACRLLRVPRALDEVSGALSKAALDHVKGSYKKPCRKGVARCYRELLKLGVVPSSPPPRDPKDFVGRIASSLELSGEVVKRAVEIVERAKELGLTGGKDPAGVAAGAVYLACLLTGGVRHRATQRAIARASGVTEVTVRNRYRELAVKLRLAT